MDTPDNQKSATKQADESTSRHTATPVANDNSIDTVKLRPEKQRTFARFSGISSLLQLVVGAVVIAFVINRLVFQSYEVFGRSMTPTLQEQDRLVISKLGKSWASVGGNDYVPDRGTIIVFNSPRDPNVQLIKRVIGLPGDRVVVEDGAITVFNTENPSGFNPDEAYEDNLIEYTTGDKESFVGSGELFVSGDNRNPGGSLDSRNELGLVPTDNVIGELVLRLLPIGDASVF